MVCAGAVLVPNCLHPAATVRAIAGVFFSILVLLGEPARLLSLEVDMNILSIA